ncbi:MAG TPA: peptidase S41, partial [Burkholderiaceae bacterium]|nr:peptidase S41 [Burkholderiaceae bacterium]
ETAEGNLFAALRTREADLAKHLENGQGEAKDPEREQAREEARKRLADDMARHEVPKPPPEYGSAEDFQLTQALNQLKGETVLASKTAVERTHDAKTAN